MSRANAGLHLRRMKRFHVISLYSVSAYGSGELNNLVLAYATTIHKSQGSEWHCHVAE